MTGSASSCQRIDPAFLAGDPLPDPNQADDKESRGRVLIVGGGWRTPGAVLLAGIAALRAGSGKLAIMTAAAASIPLAVAMPEAMVEGLPETPEGEIAPDPGDAAVRRVQRCDGILLGPGMLDPAGAASLVQRMLSERGTAGVVLDAAAIHFLKSGRADRRTIITPHAGEMAHLLDMERSAIEQDLAAAAARAAERFGCVVVMKGPQTHIQSPTGSCWVYGGGGIGLATSGSGDVLAGIIVGLLARGAEPEQAARWGVVLHGEAGARLGRSIGPVGYLARELLDELPGLLGALS